MEFFHVHDTLQPCVLSEAKALPQEGYYWLVLERQEPFDLPAWLKTFGKELNPRHIEDYLQVNHPSFYDGMKDYDILVYRTVAERREGGRRQFDSVTYLIFEKILITIYDENHLDFLTVKALFSEPGRALPHDAGMLAEFFINYYVDRALELKFMLDHRLLAWQKRLLKAESRSPDWSGLLDFKTDIRRIKALCEEQLDTIDAWRAHLRLHSAKTHQHDHQLDINLTDVAEHAARVVKLLTQAQQELESLMQLHFTILSHRTNEIMRILALVTGIFLPANLITGIFGMNFAHIPDLDTPHGFFFAIGGMVAISGILLMFFRWRRWL